MPADSSFALVISFIEKPYCRIPLVRMRLERRSNFGVRLANYGFWQYE
jgi:hypothetical protein